MSNKNPATPLPWKANLHAHGYSSIASQEEKSRAVAACTNGSARNLVDLEYIVHSARAYPQLVSVLRAALSTYREQWSHPGTDKVGHLLPAPQWVQDGHALLNKLGEQS